MRKRAEYPWQSELPPRDAPEASGEPEWVADSPGRRRGLGGQVAALKLVA